MAQETNIDVLYQVARDRLDAQLQRIDGADMKIGITFGLTNGMTVGLVSFISSISQPVCQLVIYFAILTAITYLVTLLLLFYAYRWSRWAYNPDVNMLRDISTNSKYTNYTDIVKKWVADECIRAIEWNAPRLTRKVRRAYIALGTLTIQGVFLITTFITYLAN